MKSATFRICLLAICLCLCLSFAFSQDLNVRNKGRFRMITGIEYPISSDYIDGHGGVIGFNLILGSQITDRIFVGGGLSPDFLTLKNPTLGDLTYLRLPIFVTAQFNLNRSKSPYFVEFRRGLSLLTTTEGGDWEIDLLRGMGVGKRFSLGGRSSLDLAIRGDLAFTPWPEGLYYIAVGLDYRF